MENCSTFSLSQTIFWKTVFDPLVFTVLSNRLFFSLSPIFLIFILIKYEYVNLVQIVKIFLWKNEGEKAKIWTLSYNHNLCWNQTNGAKTFLFFDGFEASKLWCQFRENVSLDAPQKSIITKNSFVFLNYVCTGIKIVTKKNLKHNLTTKATSMK